MRRIQRGSTDQSVVIRIIDSTTGAPETAVEYDTSGIALWYRREGATTTAITEAALAALDSAHADGGLEHIGDGYYRLDLPDAAVASAAGVNGVMVGGTVTGMIVIGCYIELTAYNPYDAVRAGLTALPNAAADAAGGLPISDAGGLDLDAIKTMTDKIGTVTNTGGTATIGAILGDVANVALAARLITIQADTDLLDDVSGGLVDIHTDVAAVKTDTAAILLDTAELQTDWVNGGRLDLILDIIAADTTTDIPALIDALPTAAEIKTAIEAAGGHLALILEDTGTTLPALLPAALVGGRMDCSVGAMANGTITAAAIANAAIDQATFAADVFVVANVKKVNDATLTGNGSALTPWGPA